MFQGQELVIGNVGDSRAVLGYREDNSLIAIQLTVDLKPVDGFKNGEFNTEHQKSMIVLLFAYLWEKIRGKPKILK
ncbi:hypothetical protein ZOSMA_246G00020 [Zostera marina]|uniref:protein-serine/threonine phosphatase n=1 Tax=Zostera marina TaxID=29655 RepID=A0A0K9PJ15_ZOSMR|nr:hypothetical protein ZOSMA_246G00020 [Zostera marina]